MRVADFGAAVPAIDEVVHHAGAERSRAVQGGQRDQILEHLRLQLADVILHAARFELEHRGGVATREQGVGLRVVQRQCEDFQRLGTGRFPPCVDRLHRPVDDRQRAQAEEVELDQADRFDVVLVELGDDGLGRLALADVFGEQRGEIAERARRDHHAAGVLAGIAGQVLELEREVHQVAHVVFVVVALDQLAGGEVVVLLRRIGTAERVVQGDAERIRDELGDAVDETVGQAEHAAAVAHDGLRRHRAVGDDLADLVAAVLARDVVDHLVAAIHAEVDVEVGHRHAFGIEEALEQQVVAQGVEVGDAQRPGHQRTRAGTAAGSDRDVVALTPVDEVGDDQEVAGEAHLHDDVEFGLQPGVVVGASQAVGQCVRLQAAIEAAPRFLADPRFQRMPFRHREVGQVIGAERELQVAALGQFHRVFERFGNVGEQRRHLFRRFQVLLGAEFARSARIVEHAAGGDAHARLVRTEIVAFEEAHVVRGDQRQAEIVGQGERGVVERFFAIAMRARQFQVQAVGEGVAPGAQAIARQLDATGGHRRAHRAFATGDHGQAFVLAEQP